MRRVASFVRATDGPVGGSIEPDAPTYSEILDILLTDLLVAGDPRFVAAVWGPPDATGTRVVSW